MANNGKRFRRPAHWTLAQILAHYSAAGPDGCHLWTGHVEANGYGVLKWVGRFQKAHRMAWRVANGPIPCGKMILHKCDVRRCINPDHLWCDTATANMADMVAKGRQTRGEMVGLSKLTAVSALEVYHAKGLHREIGAKYGISGMEVGRIKRRQRWKHLHD